ncbi:4-hydroxy-tetrahydrodipicolinate synthase [Acinetobacter calcoaceticus]|uniref:4-hydroxy-tetrahydrodipicolinate synthase n=1 Tax=Acinetobacter calcoaceticus TaxID=471 RepID=A0A4R1XQF8_ACICA|nr:4-hydroxy-tetrahydrodipicolinate synthase [Acinetobacter calcoaceticus]
MILGNIVALVTPMNTDGTLDFISLEKLIDFHHQHGTAAIVIAGSTGESETLSFAEQSQLIEKSVQFADGRIPIIAGIGSNATHEAIALARMAKQYGAVAGLSVVPFYNKPTQQGMLNHFDCIAEGSGLPQILYNIPSRSVCDMHNDTILRLAENPLIIGLKDATSNMGRTIELLNNLPADFALYAGNDDSALPFMLVGGHGVISVSSNIVPQLMNEMSAYALAGDAKKAREVNAKLYKLHQVMGIETNPIPIKYAMATLGMIGPEIRMPLTELDQQYHQAVMQVVNEVLA